MWAEKRTKGESNADSSSPSDICSNLSDDPLANKGEGEEVGRDEVLENGTGWGETEEARNGTAAGRNGEENTGGPGGELKCGIEPPDDEGEPNCGKIGLPDGLGGGN